MTGLFPSLSLQYSQYIAYFLVALAAFYIFAPEKYQSYIPFNMSKQTKEILAVVFVIIAYYLYNGQKW